MNRMPATPPPLPPQAFPPVRKGPGLGAKIAMIVVQCVVLFIATLIVWGLTYDRQSSVNAVADRIAAEWGGEVNIKGPIAYPVSGDTASVVATTMRCAVKVNSRTLHRGIYEAEVYDAEVAISGSFDGDRLSSLGREAKVEIEVPARKIYDIEPFEIEGRKVEWRRRGDMLSATISTEGLAAEARFSTSFRIHGSGRLEVAQIGENTFVTMEGEASNPSFVGVSLPDDRAVTDRAFSAQWESEGLDAAAYNRMTLIPEEADEEAEAEALSDTTWTDTDYVEVVEIYGNEIPSVGAQFLVGVDRYRKVSRSLKYAFIIIVLTFISLLFTEVITRRQIPLLNYFLIGAALVMFYLLLLSFVEFASFGAAYFVAASMTVLLIGIYMWRMQASLRVGLTISSILVLIYSCCYVMLCLGRYALVLGSLILFASLAAAMWASLKLKR